MPLEPSRSSRHDRYTEEWLGSRLANVTTPGGKVDKGGLEDGLATHIYLCCRDILRVLCSSELNGSRENIKVISLREELTKLYLWGQNFSYGELDCALEYSDDVYYIVLDAFWTIGQALLQETKQLFEDLTVKTNLGATVMDMSRLVDQVKIVISNRTAREDGAVDDTAEDSDTDSLSEESSIPPDTLGTIRRNVGYLVELGPTIQENLVYARKARIELRYPPIVPFQLSNPAQTYAALVREKFPLAEKRLADRLGESNWQRHIAVRKLAETMSADAQRSELSENDDTIVLKIKAEEEAPISIFRPFSSFRDSGIGTSVPQMTTYAPSHTSFRSSRSESDSMSKRVPPTPEEVGAGIPFICPFCQQTQASIKNRVDWKIHVFADLCPYLCTFADCKDELARFSTRAEWANHEFSEHRVLHSWGCPECKQKLDSETAWSTHMQSSHDSIFKGSGSHVTKMMACATEARPAENEECPMCRAILRKSRRDFVKHVGRHFEDIALMSLPQEIDDDSDAHSSSTESGSMENPTHKSSDNDFSIEDGFLANDVPYQVKQRQQNELRGAQKQSSKISTLLSEESEDAISSHPQLQDQHSDLSKQDVKLHTQGLHFGRFTEIPCELVAIGACQLRTFPFVEIRVFYNIDDSHIFYSIIRNQDSCIIVVPFESITNISHNFSSTTIPHIQLELNCRRLKYFRNGGTDSKSTEFRECKDFTRDQEGTTARIHRLCGGVEALGYHLHQISTCNAFKHRRSAPVFSDSRIWASEWVDNRGQPIFSAERHARLVHQNSTAVVSGEKEEIGMSALEDYQMQLMLLEATNKKRLLMVGQEGPQHNTLQPEPNNNLDYQSKLLLLEEQNKKRLLKARQGDPQDNAFLQETPNQLRGLPGKPFLNPQNPELEDYNLQLMLLEQQNRNRRERNEKRAVESGTTDILTPEGDEYIPREVDANGDEKISSLGELLGGRQFKIRSFNVLGRGHKRFMRATECARVLGYRDSYLLFKKNRTLYKIIITQAEKDDLIHQEIILHSDRNRQIAIVTAKSMFRQFGARIIEGGRRVRDDYWEAKAIKQGFTEYDEGHIKRPRSSITRKTPAAPKDATSLLQTQHVDNSTLGKNAAAKNQFDQDFEQPYDLTKDEKPDSRPWKCNEPSCKFSQNGWHTEKERDRHVHDKHAVTSSVYKCRYHPCPYESKRESNCKQHMEWAHGCTYIRSKSSSSLKTSQARSHNPEKEQ